MLYWPLPRSGHRESWRAPGARRERQAAMGQPFSFGQILKHFRITANLTQEALAEQARLGVRSIQALEAGASHAPRPETVALLAAALQLSPREQTTFAAAAHPRSRPPLGLLAEPPGASESTDRAFVPVVGRVAELSLLERHLAGAPTPAGRGSPPLLLLAGEPGIGKSRLLQEAALRGVAQGMTVLTGGCHRQGSQEPYAPLLDALARHLHAEAPGRRRAALVGCAWLVRLLPELAALLESVAGGTLPPAQERRLMFAAVARVVANVAGPAGTLLVLDDLQWAGPDALALLTTLVRSPGLPLRVVGAYRDTEVRPADPLGLLLADLAQAGLARQHQLGPLAPEEAAALLTHLLADGVGGERGLVEGVMHRAGGTPFFLVSYAEALHQGSTQGVPWDLTQGVRQRVALLPAIGQDLLGAAAIVGRWVPRALLMAIVGQPLHEVLVGLEAACGARLLLEEGEDTYAFTHDVIREVLEADLGAARRAMLHHRVAEALEQDPRGVSPERLAYHYARGGAQDRAALYLEQAGDHAWGQRAPGVAEGHYRGALEALEHHGHGPDALRVREKLGDMLYETGRYEAAIAVLEPAADAYRAGGDPESLGRVAAQIGWMHSVRGTPRQGLALIQPLVGLLDRGGASPAMLALYATWGQLLFAAGQYEASLAANERALALASGGGDGLPRVRAAYNRLVNLLMLGRLADALRASRDVLPVVEAAGHPTTLLAVLRDVSYIHALRGEVVASRAHIERAAVVARQMEDPGPVAYTLAQRAWVVFLGGDGPGARAALDEAVALSRRGDQSWYSSYPPIFRARLSLTAGNRVEARAAAREALALADAADDLQGQRWASTVSAELDILEGRPGVARDRLVPLLDRPGLEECDVTTLLPALAWAYLELDRVEQAAATVGQAIARARRGDMRLVLVEALRVRALLALRQEQWDVATRSLEEGVALARSIPFPYAEARLLLVDGVLHAQQGGPQAARARLEAARFLFARLGAHADAARTAQALRALPGAPSSAVAGQRVTPVPARPDGVTAVPAGQRLARADRQAWALARLRADGPLSPRAYATALGVSVDTALRDLGELTRRGHIAAQGATKDRRYVLCDTADQVRR